MKKVLFIILFFFALYACQRTERWSVTLYKSLTNNTNKDLYYEVQTDEGNKDEFVFASDSITMMFHREHDVKRSILETTVRQSGIKIERETVYNLSDTGKFEYNLEYENNPQQGNTKEEKIFSRHLAWELGEKSTEINVVIIVKLNVTDSIVQIMQKDYSMLDKFKEYYDR
jgi:hypothetical protein